VDNKHEKTMSCCESIVVLRAIGVLAFVVLYTTFPECNYHNYGPLYFMDHISYDGEEFFLEIF
jgi:hypothetical protein